MNKINSITAYKIIDLNGLTLADIRTDGKKALVLDDKSNGIIKNLFMAGWVRGREIIDKSMQYKIQPNPGIGIYYFSLSTGDALAVTTDDRCAALNGEICDEVEFEKLLHLLNTKQITATSASQGSPVSMLYNLAEHVDDEPHHKFDINQANEYGKMTADDNEQQQESEDKPNLNGLTAENDSLAIKILKTTKVEA